MSDKPALPDDARELCDQLAAEVRAVRERTEQGLAPARQRAEEQAATIRRQAEEEVAIGQAALSVASPLAFVETLGSVATTVPVLAFRMSTVTVVPAGNPARLYEKGAPTR